MCIFTYFSQIKKNEFQWLTFDLLVFTKTSRLVFLIPRLHRINSKKKFVNHSCVGWQLEVRAVSNAPIKVKVYNYIQLYLYNSNNNKVFKSCGRLEIKSHELKKR
jgi:hypothetical protein